MTAAAVDWRRLRGVVFDLDGTLYDPRPLRLRMAVELMAHALTHREGREVVRILRGFRRQRELLAEQEAEGVAKRQYEEAAQRLGVPAARVEAVVREWMHERPLRHLRAARRPGAAELFAALRAGGRKIGVLSDYPTSAKLAALGLECDAELGAEDPEIDRFKPHPAGLELLLRRLEIEPRAALVVGDRDERDGECARRLGCPYLVLARRPRSAHEIGGLRILLVSLATYPGGAGR